VYRYMLGIDFGQAQDYTAIVIVQRNETAMQDGLALRPGDPIAKEALTLVSSYELRHIERPKLGTPFPDIVGRIGTLLQAKELASSERVCIIDLTGCGRPILDMMRRAGISPIVALNITGGDMARQTPEGFNVPKKELVTALQMYLQSGRLKIAAALPETQALKNEMLNFKVKVKASTGEESYEAWRENDHDDMVLATAMVCWYAHLHDDTNRVIDEERIAKDADYDILHFGTREENTRGRGR